MDLSKVSQIQRDRSLSFQKKLMRHTISFVTSTLAIYLLRLVLPNGRVFRVIIIVTSFFIGEFVAEIIT